MLTLRCASAPAISRMMPGRSCPTRCELQEVVGTDRTVVGGDGDGDVEQALRRERVEFGGEVVGAFVGDRHHDDAGELSGQSCHVGAVPVAAVAGDRAGEGVDEPGSIVADHGEHERCHDGSLPRLAATARVWSSVRSGAVR